MIVEDDRQTNDAVAEYLKSFGYRMLSAYDGDEALQLFECNNIDLIILDIMIPKKTGLAVLHTIRAKSSVPILMLTAIGDEYTQVTSFDEQADDYITKPFSVREVMARIKANLRKWDGIETNKKDAENTDGTKNSMLEFGPLVLDTYKYETKVDGKNVDLTLREFELLKFLATQKGQVFSREELLERVWGYEYFGDVRTVDVTVRRIREKIERNPSTPELLATKRGIGYYFNA